MHLKCGLCILDKLEAGATPFLMRSVLINDNSSRFEGLLCLALGAEAGIPKSECISIHRESNEPCVI